MSLWKRLLSGLTGHMSPCGGSGVASTKLTEPPKRGFPGIAVVKNLPANAGDSGEAGSIPGWGRSSGVGYGSPLQYSCLENSMDRWAWWLRPWGCRVKHNWAHKHTCTKMFQSARVSLKREGQSDKRARGNPLTDLHPNIIKMVFSVICNWHHNVSVHKWPQTTRAISVRLKKVSHYTQRVQKKC